MKILLTTGVISALVVIFASAEVVDYGIIKVIHSSEFPHYSDQLFYLFFSSRAGQFPIYSLMIFIIRDGARILEKGYFYPGFFYELEYPFIGEYLQLLVATVQTNHSISVRIQFNEIANWRQLEVRYGEFVSREKMNHAKENFWLYTSVMYSRTLQLLIRTILSLNTLTADGRMDGVLVTEPGYLVCRGSRGYPRQKVRLFPIYGQTVIDEQYDDVINTHKMKVWFELRHHRAPYECTSIDIRETAYVNVFHHPTKLRLEPSYYSTMPNGSSVKCVSDDGFPEPKMLWYFVRGPTNPDWYFNVYQDQLFLLPNAPIGSKWTFKCVAENIIPNSQTNSTFLLFNFTVIHSSYRQLILMASSAGGVLCVATIIIVIVVIFRPRKTTQRRPSSKPERRFEKELAFDPDTACSVKLSQSSECVRDGQPRYDNISNGDVDPLAVHGTGSSGDNDVCATTTTTNDKKVPLKDGIGTCYV